MKRTEDIAALFRGLMNAKMPYYLAAGVNVDWFGHSVNSPNALPLSYWAFEKSVPPVCGFCEAKSESRMGSFKEHINEKVKCATIKLIGQNDEAAKRQSSIEMSSTKL